MPLRELSITESHKKLINIVKDINLVKVLRIFRIFPMRIYKCKDSQSLRYNWIGNHGQGHPHWVLRRMRLWGTFSSIAGSPYPHLCWGINPVLLCRHLYQEDRSFLDWRGRIKNSDLVSRSKSYWSIPRDNHFTTTWGRVGMRFIFLRQRNEKVKWLALLKDQRLATKQWFFVSLFMLCNYLGIWKVFVLIEHIRKSFV